MRRVSIICVAALYAVVSQNTANAQSTRFMADGAGTESPRACDTDWAWRLKDDNSQVSPTVTDGCLSIAEFPPLTTFDNGFPSAAGHAITDGRTNVSFWCSFKQSENPDGNEFYQPDAGNDNAFQWGYCLDTELDVVVTSPPTADGVFADGGFQATPVECDSEWFYKPKDDDDAQGPFSGCVSITDFPPYGFDPFALEGDDALVPPTNLGVTDTSMWCSVKVTLDPDSGNSNYSPDANDLDNRRSWGYCFDTANVGSTPVPTVPEATPEPTVTEATPEPTASEGTPTPTDAPDLLADGGFQATPIECDDEWFYKPKDDDDAQGPFTGCVSITDFPPYGFDPFTLEGDDALVPPTEQGVTDTTMWCSVKVTIDPDSGNSNYSPDANDLDNRRSWGYCLDTADLVDDTNQPTPMPADPSTPTVSPVTGSTPSTAPTTGTTGTNPTAPPVASPTTDGLGANNTEAPTGETAGVNVAAAVAIPLVLVFAGVGAFGIWKWRQINQAEAAGAAGAADAKSGKAEETKPDEGDTEQGQAAQTGEMNRA